MSRYAKTLYVQSIISAQNSTKQELGRRFAAVLGLVPGPRGPDDGIDGSLEFNGRKIYFQSKLSKKNLGVDEAKKFIADSIFHKVDISIELAGVGYTKKFLQRVRSPRSGLKEIRIHLITLKDIFFTSNVFKEALKDLPKLKELEDIMMRSVANNDHESSSL